MSSNARSPNSPGQRPRHQPAQLQSDPPHQLATAAEQLGSDKPAVRLAGVYAMAGLADDWEENRQVCIDVLCAYLRMPYEPDPGSDAPTPQRLAFQAIREVRHTVIRVITAHLRKGAPTSWQGLHFDFCGVVFDGGDFSFAQLSGGGLEFQGARFCGGEVSFRYTQFCGADVYFRGAQFSGGKISFDHAEFSDGWVNFYEVEFSGSEISFADARFSGGKVEFGSEFAGGTISFTGAHFSGSRVRFSMA